MQKKEIDFILTLVISALIIFGVIMISSVSVYSSYIITQKQVARWILSEPHNAFYLTKTIIHVVIGFIAMIIMAKIPYQNLEKFSWHIYLSSVFLLFIVLFFESVNWARWWINIPWIPTIQPVEIAKLGLIIFLAYFMKKRRPVMQNFKFWFLSFFLYVSIILWLLALQPDFGSILIITPIALVMYFIGWWSKKFLIYGIILSLVGAVLVYGFGKTQLWQNLRVGYISQRIDNFFRSDLDISKSKLDDDRQLRQWFIALGSGGFFGLWLSASVQKYWYLPEVQWDFIFSVIVEEFGFVWWFLLLMTYSFIAYRWFRIARSVPDLFGKYVAFGISSWFLIQAFVNIGVNMNVVPLTGVTLPFVSYGGSSIIILCAAVWILLSISRNMEYKPQNISDAIQARRKIIF